MDESKTGPRAVFWYAADLGGEASLTPVSRDSRDAVLGGLGASLELVMPNMLGARPQGFSFRLTPRALGDLTPAALVAATPFLAAAMECRGRAGEPGLAAEYPALDRLIAALAPAAPKPADADIDRLFAMLDLGEATPEAGGDGEALLARQVGLLLDDPALLRLEAAWRGIALFLDGIEADAEVEIRLISAPREVLAERVIEALEALDPEDASAPDAMLLAEVFDPRGPHAATLGALAVAAEAASVPLIAEAPADFLGLKLAEVATRHDPTAMMEGPAWNSWRGLRQKEPSRWLGLAWNRPWLRNAHELRHGLALPGFAGENLPGPAVAVIGALLANAARQGWPSALTAQTVAGPALAVIEAGGSREALAVEAAIGGETAKLLAGAGLLALTGRPGRATISLPVAQSVKAPGRIGGDNPLARERASLPFMLASGRVTRAITAMHADVAASPDPAEACAARLRALLAGTGPGAGVEVTTLPDPEEPGGRMLEVRLRFGAEVLGGAALAMDVPLG